LPPSIDGAGHGSEFDQLEDLTVKARTPLSKQHRATQLNPHDQRHDQQQRQPNQKQKLGKQKAEINLEFRPD
jgi:hypothetical protein